MTADSLPYIGPHRRYPRHWFALGYGGNGMTFGFLAARLLLERWQGVKSRDHALFEFARLRTMTAMSMQRADIRIGTAGWSIPRAAAFRFDSAGTHLERYSRLLRCAEINSSFYRPHAAGTYAKWRDRTPPDFRFAVKMPRTITHELRLQDAREPLVTFLAQTDGLAEKTRADPRAVAAVAVVRCLRGDPISGPRAKGVRRAHGLRAEARDVVLAGRGIAAGSVRSLTSRGRSATGAGSSRSRGLATRRIFSAARITAEVLVTI